MSKFGDRAFAALARFNGHLSALVKRGRINSGRPAAAAARRRSTSCSQITARARTASDAIARSFTLIDLTALDIVDMQVRLQGETARLASALRELGERSDGSTSSATHSTIALVAARRGRAAGRGGRLPQRGRRGCASVNVKLWDFEKIRVEALHRHPHDGRAAQPDHVRAAGEIQSIADDVARAFADVNTLLNDLAESRAADADVAAAAARRRRR